MAGGSDIRAGKAFVEIYLNKSALVKDLKGIGTELKSWSAGITSMGTKLAMAGAAVTAPMLAAVHSWAAAGTELGHMSERTGMSVQSLAVLRYAAARNGVEFASLEHAAHRVNRSIVEAAQGSQASAVALARLGLSSQQLLRMAPDDRFFAIADALNKIQNPAIKDAAAMQLMGRGAAELGATLRDLNASRAEAAKYGLITSPESAEAAMALTRAWTLLGKVFGSIKEAIGTSLQPMLTGLVRWLAEVSVKVREWIKDNRSLVVTIFQVGAGLLGLGTGLIFLGKGIGIVSKLFSGSATLIMGFGHILGIAASVLGFVLSPIGFVIAGLTALGVYFLWSSGEGKKAADWLGESFGDLLSTAKETFGAIADALSAGDITSAVRVLWAFIKLEWTKGTNFILDIWDWFRGLYSDAVTGLAILFTEAVAKIQTVWVEMTARIQTIWVDSVAAMQTAWIGFKGFFADAGVGIEIGMVNFSASIEKIWVALIGKLKQLWNSLKGFLVGNVFGTQYLGKALEAIPGGKKLAQYLPGYSPAREEVKSKERDEANRKIQEETDAKIKDIEAKRQGKYGALGDRAAGGMSKRGAETKGIQDEAQKRKDEIERDRAANVGRIAKGAQGATDILGQGALGAAKERDKRKSDRESDLDAAKKELDDATKHARTVGAKHRADLEGKKPPGLGGADLAGLGGGGKIQGTFSGAAAGMIGGSGGFQMLGKKLDRQNDLALQMYQLNQKWLQKMAVGA
jgi:hypothetical protein